jgi:hypothetical protein
MTICGYNDTIGGGLRMLVDGMVEALEKKAAKTSVQEVLEREAVELEAMITTMRTAQGETLPEMFVGLNLLAKALFQRVQEDLKLQNSDDLGAACREIGESFIELLSDTETEYEVQREAGGENLSAQTCAREVAEWALRRSALLDGQKVGA